MSTGGGVLGFATEAAAWGGAEACLASLISGLSEPVTSAVLFGPDAGVLERLGGRCPVPVRTVVVAARRGPLDPWPLARWVAALRRNPVDGLHVNAAFTFGSLYPQAAALLCRTPYVVQEHLPLAPGRPRLQLPVKRRLSRSAARHVAVSTRAARETELFGGLAADTVEVIPNGVPDIPPGPPGGAGPALVVGIGRLTRQKGFDLLLEAVAGLDHVDVRLVGDGPERAALTALADRLDMSGRLEITGWLPDARAHLGEATVVAVPSRHEAAQLVLLEAMAARRPVVATDVGHAAEALDGGRCGRVVAVGDVAALRAGVISALEGGPDVRARVEAARERYEQRYTEGRMIQDWQAVYAGILATRPVRAG